MGKILDKGVSEKKCPLEIGKNYCSFECEFYCFEIVETPIEVSECYQKEKTELFRKAR